MTIYKRIGSFLLSLLLVFSMFGSTFAIQTFAATSPALSVESKAVNAGEQFTVAVSLANATTVYGGNFTLQYDSSLLTADSYEFSSIVSGHTKNCNLNYQSAGNLIRVTFSGASAVTSSGTLVIFTFTAKESISGSAALQFNAYKMYDENGSSITSTATGSTITIATEPVVSPTLSITSKTVTEGSTISVPIVISDSEAVYGGNFTLQYDSNLLSADSYSFGSIVSGHTKNCNLDYQSAGNLIRVTFSGAEAISSDGTLITLTFTAKAAGTASLQFNAYKMYDENGTSIDTTVSDGNVTINPIPDIDTTKPTVSVSSTNNAASSQTVTLTMSDNEGVVSYYWGTNPSPTSDLFTTFTSTTSKTVKVTVPDGSATISATYTLIAKDASGNTASTNITFYRTKLDANGGSVSPASIFTKRGVAIDLPTPTRSGYAFAGWGTTSTSTSGVKTITPTSAQTYYAVWTKTTPDIISGQCGENAYFEIDVNSGLLTVSGSGLTYDWSEPYDSEAPSDAISLYTYKDYILTAVIENGITSIGNDMFRGCSSLTSVKIANSVENLGWRAFENCTKLSNVEFVDGSTTTQITFRTFAYCSSLTNIELPKNVKITGARPFEGCYNLTDIDVADDNPNHSSVNGVLYDKNKTKIICFPSGAGESYTIPNGVKTIGSYAFTHNKILKSVVIPETVTKIEQDAFAYSWVLESITIPSSVTEIGAYAFDYCSELKTATIYNKDVSFGYKVFDGCDELTVYGYKGSTTQTYAVENSITFIPLTSDLVSMGISAFPGETLYIGDQLDVDTIQIRVEYSDGTEDILTDGFTVTGFDSSSAGTKTVTVSYEGLTDTYSVTVYTPSITLSQSSLSLSVDDSAALTARTSPSGKTVTWISSNTSVATVSGGTVTAKASGSATITAKFTYNGTTYSKTCSVTVSEVVPDEPTPTSLSVSTKPTKTTYEIGESLNTSGLKLKLTYSDGSTETITSGFTVSGFSSTTAGTKTVTVKYGSLTTTFTVTVNEPIPVDGPRVTVESKKARVGSTVLITVSLEENPGIWGMDLVVNYDKTQLTLTSVTNGTVFSSSEWTQGNLSGDKYILSYEASGFDNITTNGVLATLEFTVNENATVDSFASVSLSYNAGDIINVSFDDINVAIVSGGINITDFVYGDLNSDGLVNKKDSLLMKMYLADNSTTIDMQAADVYVDGSINKKDSLYLKQYLAGLDVELGA